jgi:tetratricopeptide (TPR) repeat protein
VPSTVTTPPPAPAPKAEKPGFLSRLNPFRGRPEKPQPPVVETGRVFTANPASTGTVAAVPAVTKPVYPHYTYRRPSPPAPGRRADAEQAYSKGVAAQRVKATNEAILSYQLAVSADPSYFQPYHNYALLLQATQPKDSLAVWETALAIQPDSVESRYSFALALKQAGFPHEAAEEMERVLTARPQDVQTHLNLGNLYAQQLSDVRRARPHYLKVIELDPRNSQASAIRYWLNANP